MYAYDTSPPTICPNDAGHTVNDNSVGDPSQTLNYTAISADYTLTSNSIVVDTSGGNVTVTLPPAVSVINQLYMFKKTSASNTLTINPNGSEQIDSAATLAVTAITTKEFVSNGTEWFTYNLGVEIPFNVVIPPPPPVIIATSTPGSILVAGDGEILSIPPGTDGQVLLRNSALSLGFGWLNATTSNNEYYIVTDVKPSGEYGGEASKDTWQTRDLNTMQSVNGSSCSVSSNQITLTAGTYIVEASVPSYRVRETKVRFYNITDSTTDIVGTSDYHFMDCGRSNLAGSITLASSKTFELQQWSDKSINTNGLGNAVGAGVNEVYSTVKIVKIA